MKTRSLLALFFAISIAAVFGQPANDNFASRIVLTGSQVTTNGTTVGATREANESNAGFNNTSASVWYEWTAVASSSVTMGVTGNYREVLGVFTGTAVNALTLVRSSSASAFGGTSTSFSFTPVAGTSYKIMVAGRNVSGTFNLTINQPLNPVVSISSPASGLAVTNPATINLTASVSSPSGAAITNVTYYYQGTTKIGTATTTPYAVTWNNLPVGNWTVIAQAIDNAGRVGTSSGISVSVLPAGYFATRLVPTNFVWKYLDNGTDPGANWMQPNYNDSGFTGSGPGSFGYGDPSVTTNSFGADPNNKYPAYYYRTKFVVTNAQYLYNLTSRMRRDDGVIVYLNGTEVIRNNMAAGAVTFADFAAANAGDDGVTVYVDSISSALLVSGTNTLAAEIHQDSATSSDITFEFQLDGEGANNNLAPTVAITSPASNQLLMPGTNVTISANASDADGTVTNVAFYAGAVFIGQDGTAPYSVTWSNLQEGDYTLTAVATDNGGSTTTSSGVDVRVATSTVVPVSLIATGSVWKYLDNGTDQGTAWQALPFNDSTWSSGPAELGYGDTSDGRPEATVLGFGPDSNNKYITYYFRRLFTATNLAAISNLTINLVRDDGAVVYINGVEVRRDNMPAGVINFTTLATSPAVGGTDEATFFSSNASPTMLVNGTNVIAVEIHQQLASSTDVSFDLSLIANTIIGNLPTNTIAPFVKAQNPLVNATVTTLTAVQVTFSEAVNGVDAGDLLVNGSPATTVGGSGNVYTFGFPQPAFGTVAITWSGSHGIVDIGNPPLPFDGTAASNVWTYTLRDDVPPTIVSKTPPDGAGVTNLNEITVVFSEAVQGVDPNDLLVNGIPALQVSGSGTTYTFQFGQPALGTVNISWVASPGIVDISPTHNAFNPTGTGATWSYTLQQRMQLVATNSVWKYFKGLTEASSPVDIWRNLSFNDSTWLTGAAPFYYDADVPVTYYGNTVLNDMQNQYISVFLRSTFVLPGGGASITNFTLKSKCDDGFICWINGVEVFRSTTMPNGQVAFNQTVNNANEPLSFTSTTLPTSVLSSGTNIVAVQLHNTTLNSSDILLDLELYGDSIDASVVAPTLTSVTPSAGQVFALSSITVNFSEPVINVDAADLLINGTPATGVAGSNMVFTFTFPQPAYGPVSVTWASGHGIQDLDPSPKLFNGSGPGASFQYTLLNPNAPTISGQAPLAGATVGSLSQVVVTFNKAVSGVNAADLLINGVGATGLTGGPTIYTFTFPQPGFGPVAITWVANHGIADQAQPVNAFDATRPESTWTYTLLDQAPPTLASKSPPAGATVTNLTSLTVTFSEAVNGVNASDLLLNGIPASGMVSNSPTSYTFSFAPPNSTQIDVTWANSHGITDTAATPNAFNASGAGATWSYSTPDTVAPTVVTIDPAPFITVRSLSTIRVTFSEPVVGVDAGDLILNNQPATSVAGSGAGPYIFAFASQTNRTVEVRWSPTHGISDLATPQNAFPGGEWTYIYDPNASFVGNVVINEIMYDSLTGRPADEWIELANVTGNLINLTGWKFTKGVNFTFPNVSIPPYGFLVVAANLASFQANYPGVTNVIGGWTGSLGNNGENIELKTALGDSVSQVQYASEGDWAVRERGNGPSPVTSLTRSGSTVTASVFSHGYTSGDQVIITGATQPEYNGRFTIGGITPNTFTYTIGGTPLSPATGAVVSHLVRDDGFTGWGWFSAASGMGSSLEAMNPKADIGTGENWSDSLSVGGTPGRTNSVYSTDIAPLVTDVKHFPPVPRSTDTVTISAKVKDELPAGISSVQLLFRNHTTTSPGAFVSTNMFDDGLHNDGSAGDGSYAAILPAAANGTIIEFYVRATDTTGHIRTWPAAAWETNGANATFGTTAQIANALYMVDNEVTSNTMPVIRAVMTATEDAVFPPGTVTSDAAYNCTMIAMQAGNTDIRYLCDVRIRGQGTRGRNTKNNRLNIPNDNTWNGRSAINLNSQYVHAQLIGNLVAEEAGILSEQPYVVQYRVNGINPAPLTTPGASGDGAGWGTYLLLRPVDGELAAEGYPQDGSGNTYRASSGNHQAMLTYQGTDPAAYLTRGYFKTSNRTENDWTDLFNLTAAFSFTGANADYVQFISTNVNVVNWMTYFALTTLLNDGETKLGNGLGDDYGFYRGLIDKRFVMQAHDFDTIFGEGDTGASYYPVNTNSSIFVMLNPPNANANMTLLRRFMTNNAFVPFFYGELKRLCDTVFAPANLGPLIDQHLLGWGVGPDSTVTQRMKRYAENRRQIALSQIPLNLTVETGLTVNNGYLSTSTASLTLRGYGNAIDTRRVRVNGQDASWVAFDARWTNIVTLLPGINHVLVQTLDSNNVVFAESAVDIWYNSGASTSVSGTIATDISWTAAAGPYLVTGNITVNSGATLTIQPGTTVYLNSGVNLVVANGGRLLAQGTETAHIRLTRQPGTAVNWGNIQINGAVGSPESRLTYVDFDANVNNANTPALQVTSGTVFCDHLTFAVTGSPYIHVDSASFIIQNCVFPTATASFELVHGNGGVKSGGRGIFLRNFFGVPNGYNDVVDFTGGNRPGQPIVQFLNNVFIGASDDILDLDGTDAWIEGNIFLHTHKNGSPDSSSAISGGLTGTDRSELTIVGNLFYDCDQIANAKEGNFYTFYNNTMVHQSHAGGTDTNGCIALLADVGTAEGAGMYFEGNIIYDAEKLVFGRTNAVVTFTNNILYSVGGPAWTGPGGNNSTVDPLLTRIPQVTETSNFTSWASAQVMRDWFSLRADSPARRTGPNGLDKGGVVPIGASISGEPAARTSRNFATLTVGLNRSGNGITASSWTNGSGYWSYKWRLDGGAWSAETPISTAIALNSLANGPHYVEVSGKRDSLMFQDDAAYGADSLVTTSRTWVVDATIPAVRINEILASNGGSVPVGTGTPDLIELFNDTGFTLDLGGFGITDSQDNPFKFTFPFGTTIAAGGYLVVYANNPDSNPGVHIGFNLPQGGGALYLYNAASEGGQLLDAITYGTQLTDYSVGRMADGNWTLCVPTFGAANRGAELGDPTRLRLNEWLATGTAPFDNDFVELYNPDPLPVALGGLYMSDAIIGYPNRHQIAPLTFIPGSGYFRFVGDGNTSQGAEHLNFSLASDQGSLGLYNLDLSMIDSVVYQPQNVNISQGRSPNGGTNIVFFTTPTPGAPNPIVTGPLPFGGALVINEVLAGNANLVETSGTNTHTPDWVEIYNGTTGTVDLGDLSVTDDTLQPRRFVFAANTLIAPAGYFRVLFSTKIPVSTNNAGFGLKSTGGGVYLFDKPSNGGTLLNSVIYGLQVDDLSIGRVPDGSTNWVLASPTPAAVNVAIPTFGDSQQLKVNEWMADPSSGGDWFEIYNPSPAPVALGGLYLTDNLTSRTKHKVAPLSFIGFGTNAFIKFVADGNTSQGADHVNFSLGASGEAVGISSLAGNLIDGVTFTQQVTGVSQGRFPDGSATIVSFPDTESPGTSNYRLLTSVVINEALTHTDEPLEDAIELYNTTAQAIDISGWWLSDDEGTLKKYQIPFPTVIPARGYAVIYETHFTNRNEAAIPFALSSTGDEIVLSTSSNNILTGFRTRVNFGAAHNGVSFGRYVTSDGNEDFPSMSARTFGVDDPGTVAQFRTGTGKTNAYPKVGPVVVSQIMYHPTDSGTNDNTVDEFIELRNTGTAPVTLYDPLRTTNTWRFRDAVDFDFPAGVTLPAGARLLVVSFDPVNNAGQLAAFRAKYGLSASVPIYGPFAGKLANSDAKVELYEPDQPNLDGEIPYVLVERIHYRDSAPWPIAADGAGSSLQRFSLSGYGNDPTNWVAALPSFGNSDSDGDGLPNAWEIQYGLNPDNPADANFDSDGDGLTNLQEYNSGTNPLDVTDSLRIVNVTTSTTNAVLSFQAVANHSYTVEYKDALNAPSWSPLSTVTAAPTNRMIQLVAPEATPTRFFRIRTP